MSATRLLRKISSLTVALVALLSTSCSDNILSTSREDRSSTDYITNISRAAPRAQAEKSSVNLRYAIRDSQLGPVIGYEFQTTNNGVVQYQKQEINGEKYLLPNERIKMTIITDGRIDKLYDGNLFDNNGRNNIPGLPKILEGKYVDKTAYYHWKSMLLIYEIGSIGKERHNIILHNVEEQKFNDIVRAHRTTIK